MNIQYSGAQKLCLACIVIGGAMCVVGGIAPYWIESDPQGFSSIFDSLLDQVVNGNMGIYMYCVEILGQKGCELFGDPNGDGWFSRERILGGLCILLGGFAGLTALCLACCTCCERLIFLGIVAFLAAGCGGACAFLFTQNTEFYTSTIAGFQLFSYGWAFYVFCVGDGLLGLSSFVACFATPQQVPRAAVGPVMTHTAPPTVMINTVDRGYYGPNPQWQGQGYSGQGQAMGGPWQGQVQVMPGQVPEGK